MSVVSRNWNLKPIGEVVDINPRPDRDELTEDSLVSFVPMKCVEEESGRFVSLEDRRVAEVRKGYTPFRDGDVIFAKVTPCMENGKAAVMRGLTNGVGFGSTEFFALRPKSGVLDPYYLFHCLLQSDFRRNAERSMTGAVGLRRVPKSFLERQLIPLPTLDEQRQIVAEIEKQFTRLDAGVAALKRVQANLKRYRAAVLKAACEGKLVPTEAELSRSGVPPLSGSAKDGGKRTKAGAELEGEKRRDAASTFEHASVLLERILAERRAKWNGRGKYKEPAPPDTSNLPELPEGWVWASLEQIMLLLRNGISVKPDGENGLAILRISAVRPLKVDLQDVRFLDSDSDTYSDYILDEGDLLFTRYNGNPDFVGVCGVVSTLVSPITHPDKLIRCKLASKLTLPKYVAIVVNVGQSRSFLASRVRTTAGQSGISGQDLRGIPIPLAPVCEQVRIVSEVERNLSIIEGIYGVVTGKLHAAGRLRQAVLQCAFRGRLSDVR